MAIPPPMTCLFESKIQALGPERKAGTREALRNDLAAALQTRTPLCTLKTKGKRRIGPLSTIAAQL